MFSPSLSIVIPTYQRHDLLCACLASVTRHAPAGSQIVVVDDASPGRLAAKIDRSFPNVQLLRLNE